MSYGQEYSNQYQSFGFAAEADVDDRASFITKTYLHLCGAIGAFIACEAVMLSMPGIENFAAMLINSWMLVLFAFMGVSWVADRWAQSSTSQGMQYLGLGLYVVIEAVICLPLLFFASTMGQPLMLGGTEIGVIPAAAATTLVLFGGLTGVAFVTRKDFSFLRGVLIFGGIAAFVMIVAAMLFGFQLGLFFMIGVAALACTAILYQTSNVLHHYYVGQHVAASLALFASVATLFYYILMIFMSRD